MFRGRHSHKFVTPGEEDDKVAELRTALGPLDGCAALYCSDACLRRYLRARKWNVSKAKHMLEETLKWRAHYKPEDIKWVDVAKESETGKIYRANFVDKHGRPVIIMTPSNQNTSSHEGQIRHLVYTMESACFHVPPNNGQLVCIVDFSRWTIAHASPLKTVRETAHILQNHYPERLAVGIMLNAPKIFAYFWKLWKPFIDPDTYQKTRFIHMNDSGSMKSLEDLFGDANVKLDFEGDYNHSEYSQKMLAEDAAMATFWEEQKKSPSLNGMLSN